MKSKNRLFGLTAPNFGSKLDSTKKNLVKVVPFSKEPRFDIHFDKKNASLPGPGFYSERSDRLTNVYIPKQVRLNPERFSTISKGPGAYRHQDGFGFYSPDDS